MTIDYVSILKTERLRSEATSGATLSTESEADRSRVIFSPAFRRLQQQAQLFSLGSHAAVRSRLSHALQVAQVGRAIAGRIAAGLATEGRADGETYAALLNFVETACLMRDIGSPPFGRAGEAAVRNWFADHGPEHMRAASIAYGARDLEARDPRVLNALVDFYQFHEVAQGLRVLGKLHWHGVSGGMNLTKTSMATYLRYLSMSGGDSVVGQGQFTGHAGFFSTEAGLVKNIWSAFGYSAADPRRFPLTYVVEAANRITATFGDLEDAVNMGLVDAHQAWQTIRDDWLSTYIPIDPDEADEKIMEILGHAIENPASSFASTRATLFNAMADYAARSYLSLQSEAFSGKLDSLLSATSGSGVLISVVENYCAKKVYALDSLQDQALDGYKVVYSLFQQFSGLLAISAQRFQAALKSVADKSAADASLFLERQLLALVPVECRGAYTQLVAQVSGRDQEFEEWNARAHLIVDFIAGLSDSAALTTFRRLAAIDL